MATMSTTELLDVFKNMTVLELNEFLKAFEDEFGVTAAAPVAVAGVAAPAAGGGGGEAAEEKDNNIRVTNIYPGEVDTPILEHRPVPVTAEHKARILQPEDVAAAVLFVCALPPRANVPALIIKPTWQVYF